MTGAPHTTHTGLAVQPRQIRAVFDQETVRVYQAYSNVIADAALAQGTFVSPPFSMRRMTWIKPSFLWMMYRAGWGRKDPGQHRILAIDLKRAGFDWILRHAELAHEAADGAPVVVQWDPERDLALRPLGYRSIQIGLRGEAVERYVNEWIAGFEDVTQSAHAIHSCLLERGRDAAQALLPREQEYRFEEIAPALLGA